MMRRLVMLVGLLLAACTPDAAPTDVEADAPAYTAPPVADRVLAGEAGQVTAEGRAGPDERVRVIQMDGTAHGVTADGAGNFSISVPAASAADRLFNLSVDRSGQSVSSDGWLFSPMAAPSRAVMLRIGGASLPVGPAPLLAVVDMDAGGGVALSGRADPGTTVHVTVDGEAMGTAQADQGGRWFVVLTSTVTPGLHRLVASAGDQQMARDVMLVPQHGEGPLEASPVDGAVRIAWALPGGGSQTTWILLP